MPGPPAGPGSHFPGLACGVAGASKMPLCTASLLSPMRHPAWRLDPAAYVWHTRLQPRHADVDTLGHLNNSAVIGLHIEARQQWQMALFGPQSWRRESPLLRPSELVTHFIEEGHYPEPLHAGLRLLAVDGERWRLASGLFQAGRCIGLQDIEMRAWQQGEICALPADVAGPLATALHDQPPPTGDVLAGSPAGGDDPAALRAGPEAYAMHSSLPTRFSDLDPQRQTDALALARYAEHGRMQLLHRQAEGLPPTGKMNALVAQVRLRILRVAPPPREWQLASGAGPFGRSAMPMRTALFDGTLCHAVSDAVLVCIDKESRRPVELPPMLRARLEALQLR